MSGNEILDVGEVRLYTNSLYCLLPKKIAKKLGTIRGTRWAVTVNEDCLTNTYTVTYHFKKEEGTKQDESTEKTGT